MIRKINWQGVEAIEISAGGYEALLVPGMGANLVRLYDSGTGADILRTPSADEMEQFLTRPQLFGLPLLFPPNRIADGRFTHNGRAYNYPITIPDQNNHHHGTIKSQPFTITKQEDGEGYALVEATFFSDEENGAIFSYFPHCFECTMRFRLSAEGLTHTVVFVNRGDIPMPLGVGYHTPVNLPFISGSRAEAHTLRMSAGRRWELNERTLPTGRLLPLSDDEAMLRNEGLMPLGKPIEWAMTAEEIEVDGRPYNGAVLTDADNGLSLYYEVDDKMKHWTLWNNGGDKPWLCPEPQSWAINAPNLDLPENITGFRALDPGATWESAAKIYVKAD